MRMVVAYIHAQEFAPIRDELHALGLDALSITAVNRAGPGDGTTVHYRGAKVINHLYSAVKLECVAALDDVATIVDIVRRHAGPYPVGEDRVLVLPIDSYPLARPRDLEKTPQVDQHSAALA